MSVRFKVQHAGQPTSAFAVRYGDVVHAYLNRCAHRGTELDWQHGHFFDTEGQRLICATHGALYDPATGRCRWQTVLQGGACRVPVADVDGHICLVSQDGVRLE